MTSVTQTASVETAFKSDEESLLDRFVRAKDPAAFTGLVNKYIHFVHGVATRSLGGDASLADDVTQSVFIILSQKAPRIKSAGMIGAWLHQTTLYACANARKQKARRTHHEQIAAAAKAEDEMNDTSSQQLHPLLDQAIASLNQADRAAIIGRYMQGSTAEEIAQSLNSSPEAVQKRLERAIDKLRSFFRKKSLPITAAAVTSLLAATQSHAAPVALATTITTTSLSAAATTASVASITKGTLFMMKMIQIKLIAIVSVCVLTGGLLSVTFAQLTKSTNQPIASTQPSESIEGAWEVIDVVKKGVTSERVPEINVIAHIDSKKITMGSSVSDYANYRLNTSTTPYQIDLTDNAGKLQRGIYELDGDILKICSYKSGTDRPVNFESQLGNPNFNYIEMKRHAIDDRDQILGQWTSPGGYVDRMDGKVDASSKQYNFKVDITDTEIRQTIGNPILSVVSLQYRLDQTTSPKQILVKNKDGAWTKIGTYQLGQDSLKVAVDIGPAPEVEPTDHSTANRWNLNRAFPDDLKQLSGDWEFVGAYQNGKAAPAEQIQGAIMTFTDRFTQITLNGKVKQSATFDINPTTKQFDLHDTANPDRLIPGMYDLNGDDLRVIFDDRNAVRPTTIPTDPMQAKSSYYILKRAKPVVDKDQLPVKVMAALRNIDQVIRVYSKAHQGMMPDTLMDLVSARNLSLKALQSPNSGKYDSFVYLGNTNIKVSTLDSQTILIYDNTPLDNQNMAALFADGHAEILTKAKFDELLASSKNAISAFTPPAR